MFELLSRKLQVLPVQPGKIIAFEGSGFWYEIKQGLVSVMAELDQKMEVFKKNMKQRLIDMPTSFEDQSKLIKYLKVTKFWLFEVEDRNPCGQELLLSQEDHSWPNSIGFCAFLHICLYVDKKYVMNASVRR